MAAIESRLKKLEEALKPAGEMIIVEAYLGLEGVGWSIPACETAEEALRRVGPRGERDYVLLCNLAALGAECPRAGTPHSHAHDPVRRWPMVERR